jgi:aspartate aminotransferase
MEDRMSEVTSRRAGAVSGALEPVMRFFFSSAYTGRQGDPTIADFVVGNPHEMPLPGFVDALAQWTPPRDKDWFAYKMSEGPARLAVADALAARRGVAYRPEDIALTTGAFAGLVVCLLAVADPGDEVIFLTPPWFFYEPILLAHGLVPVRVKVRADDFDLDLAAIEAAISPRTRAIIVNSPNNPTGRVYPAETLAALGRLLTEASTRNLRQIYLLSDEAYHRLVFDGRPFPSPVDHYPHSFLIYTYGKTLLTPGQRIGYVALRPDMPEREALRHALLMAQFSAGWAFPNALLQHALADLEGLSIDLAHLQAKRDRLVAALRRMGYTLHMPEGTFYLLPRSPWPDDEAFVALLARHEVFCLPGTVVEMPGHFRISLTANDAMIDRALPGFEAAIGEAMKEQVQQDLQDFQD